MEKILAPGIEQHLRQSIKIDVERINVAHFIGNKNKEKFDFSRRPKSNDLKKIGIDMWHERLEDIYQCIQADREYVQDMRRNIHLLLDHLDFCEDYLDISKKYYDNYSRIINNIYMENRGRLGQLALDKLPKKDEEIEEQIRDSISHIPLSELSEEERNNTVSTYLMAVNIEKERRQNMNA